MSLATAGMGLVPSYQRWGVAASGLMVALRIVQGFCLGGELPGALTYVVETSADLSAWNTALTYTAATGWVPYTSATEAPPSSLPPDQTVKATIDLGNPSASALFVRLQVHR
jgi:MFS family permease